MTDLIIRGLPGSIANDGWWLASDALVEPTPHHQTADRPESKDRLSKIALLLILVLVLLADFLFWQRPIGVSLVIFSAATCAAALYSLAPQYSVAKWALIGGLWVGFALPVVAFTQFASVSILALGHAGLLIWCAMQSTTCGPILRNLMRLPYLMVMFSWLTGRDAVRNVAKSNDLKLRRETILIWLLPVVASCVFLMLFVGANPIFAQWIDRVARFDFSLGDPFRVLFWLCLGVAICPFVVFARLAENFTTGTFRDASLPLKSNAVLNPRSITISLILFNAMFLTQNATDLAFLWGGAALPDGLTYAQYAQQGAYPLMATSVLAGLFVLVSRRFIPSAPLLKVLLLIWIAQNIFLVFSALTRLGLYVDAYGLTYLRVRAGIGMCLVMAGMALLAWQLWRKKSNTWVSTAFAGLCAATLYGGCFVNFGHLIAQGNLTRADQRVDLHYLCETTPLVVAALLEHAQTSGDAMCGDAVKGWDIAPQNWRDWSLRNSRLSNAQQAYLALLTSGDVTSQRPDFTTGPMEYAR